jgi:NAD(P)-dependent dehydrogenase (short-subunit alcohol dehydrogenase family)
MTQTAMAVNGAVNATPRKILVLGATSGIAEATCRIWASRGDSLFLVARNPEKLAAVAADLRARGAGFVDTAVADLDDTEAHPALLAHGVNSARGPRCCLSRTAFLAIRLVQSRTSYCRTHPLHELWHNSLLTWLANIYAGGARRNHRGALLVAEIAAASRATSTAPRRPASAFLAGLRNRGIARVTV